MNVRLCTAVYYAVVIRCILWGSPFFVACMCSVTLMVWWGRYKFETHCGNYSRCIGSNSDVCGYRWMKWAYNKFTFIFTVYTHFKDPCSVQWRLHKKHVKKIMFCSGINNTCLKYKIHTEFATSLFQNGILSGSAPLNEICFFWLQQARSV